MKPNHTDESEPSLGPILQEWKVSASLPPRFQDRVWSRIAQAQATGQRRGPIGTFLDRLPELLLRPRLAAGCLAGLLFMGFAAGWTQGLEKSARLDQDLSSRYVRVIDPYQGGAR